MVERSLRLFAGRTWIGIGLLLLLALVILGPMLNVFLWAFTRNWTYPSLLPTVWSIEFWDDTFARADIFEGFVASVWISLIVTGLSAVICLPAAYAFARMHFPGRTFFLLSFLATNAFPRFGLYITIAVIFFRLRLIGTVPGVVLIQLVNTLLFMIWIPTAAFQGVDRALEEAALDVGASPLRVFLQVTLPLVAPALAAALLLTFVGTFYETQGALLVGVPEVQTLPVVMIRLINNQVVVQYGAILSVALWVPSLLLMIFAQRVLRGAPSPRDSAFDTMATLKLHNLVKRFGDVVAVNAVDLLVEDGEFLCLLGPSGCGKTTALRMIAGFENPTAGDIFVDGTSVAAHPANRRPTAMVFQQYTLWPHMSVFQNIAYGLRLRRLARATVKEKVTAGLDLVGLAGYENRLPSQLSGGQQQRVALARALVLEPKILLLDEPFSSLDAALRVRLREELLRIQRQLRITTIFVTHDQEEALSLADRIALMQAGDIVQLDTPSTLYAHPCNLFAAEFIGAMNLLTAHSSDSGPGVDTRALSLPSGMPADASVTLAIRPEDFQVTASPAQGMWTGEVEQTMDMGHYRKVLVALTGASESVKVFMAKSMQIRERQTIGLTPLRCLVYVDGGEPMEVVPNSQLPQP